MKKYLIITMLISLILAVASCGSDEEFNITDQFTSNDSVEVSFDLTGIDIEEMPMSRNVSDPKTYYHIVILDANRPENNYDDYYSEKHVGHLGFFTDLKYAKIKLPRDKTYEFSVTALIEKGFKLDTTQLYTIYNNRDGSILTFRNRFTEYLKYFGGHFWIGPVCSPSYENENVDRYYNSVIKTIRSNESIKIELKRLVYQLTCEIDAPYEGRIELSSSSPKFKYTVSANDLHLSKTATYSFGGTTIPPTSKTISLKLENFTSQGDTIGVATKDVIVKPNINTILKVEFDPSKADNVFDISLETPPIFSNEEQYWK